MRKKTYQELSNAHKASYKRELQTVVSKGVAEEFLQAATDANITLMRELLSSGQIVVNGVAPCYPSISVFEEISTALSRRPIVDIALYRVKKNLPALKMLLEEFGAPLPPNFLDSVETREVAEYLISIHGLDPYATEKMMERKREDDKCSYFSAENIGRMRGASRVLRPDDYEEIGKVLNNITGVLITKVTTQRGAAYKGINSNIPVSQAPWFRCASPEDAITLANFLRDECNLSFYRVMHNGSCEVYSRESLPNDTCDHSNFIMNVGTKAGIYKLPWENNDQKTKAKQCCSIM